MRIHLTPSLGFILLGSAFVLAGARCTSVNGTSTPTPALTGTVSAGPLNGATVSVYVLNSDGSQGELLGTAVTNANGGYTITMAPQSAPVVVVASGGSYVEEVSGSTVSMGSAQIRTLLASVSANQQVGVTPVTEIAAQRALASIGGNPSVGLAALITSTNQSTATALGLSDITIAPALPTVAASSASSTQAAQYAVVLASLSQIAQTATTSAGSEVNSLDVMAALATSFTYNGTFEPTVNGNPVPVPTASGSTVPLSAVYAAVNSGDSTFSGALSSATTTYTSSPAAATLGYNNPAVVPPPTYTTAPSSSVAITAPTPPTSLPSSLPPTLSGPPPLPSQTPTAAPTLTYSLSTLNLVGNTPAFVTPSKILTNGGAITSCTISPELPSPLTINKYNCVISGTPSGSMPATSYAVTVANAAGSSTASVSLAILNAPTLTYAAASGTVGTPLTITPSLVNNGAVVTNCITSPMLPSPLAIDSHTCVISGTPTAILASTTYTVTATNAVGATNASLSLSIVAAVPTIAYTTTSANTGVVGTAMSVSPSPLLSNGAAITNCTTSPTLPNPLEIDSTTCVISGTPTASFSSTNYTVSATNAVGTSTASVTLSVLPKPYHLYISDQSDGVYACAVNSSTGQITSCLAPQNLNGANIRGLSTLTSGGTTSLYAAALSTLDTCTADSTGLLNCLRGANVNNNVDTRNVTTTTVGSNIFSYAVETGTNASGIINVCSVPSAGSVTSGCSVSNANQTPPTPGLGTASGSWFPVSIDFATVSSVTTAYVVGWSTAATANGLFSCSITTATGALNICTLSTNVTAAQLAALTGMEANYISFNQISVQTINGTPYAYLVTPYNIYKCTITGSGDSFDGCVVSQAGVTAFPTANPALWSPASIAFSNLGGSNLYAYVVDTLNLEIFVCNVSSTDGSLSGCATSSNSPNLHIPYGLAVF